MLPFCCCIRDWLSADWGAIAGGGGSAAWLCWLGRARVVPTAAADEHTVQDNHQFVQTNRQTVFSLTPRAIYSMHAVLFRAETTG